METILMVALIVGFISLVIGVIGGYAARKTIAKQQVGTLEAKITQKLHDAKQEGREIILKAKDKAVLILDKAKEEEDVLKQKFIDAQASLTKREELLDKRITEVEEKGRDLEIKVGQVKEIKLQVEGVGQYATKRRTHHHRSNRGFGRGGDEHAAVLRARRAAEARRP